MSARLNQRTILRRAKEILGLAGLACLALACTVPAWAGTNPPAGNQAAAAVSQPQALPAAPQGSSSPATAQPAAPAEKNPASHAKGAHEGITVHGHWIIEVKNPDGTVASHREFENAITTQGADILTGLLSGEYVAGGFEVDLLSGGNTGLCNNGFCALYDKRATETAVSCPPASVTAGSCGTLTYTPNAGPSGSTVGYTLTGSIQPASGGQIVSVESSLYLCTGPTTSSSIYATTSTVFAQVTPQTCSSGSTATGEALTATGTATQTVVTGQSVAVTVVITFGSS